MSLFRRRSRVGVRPFGSDPGFCRVMSFPHMIPRVATVFLFAAALMSCPVADAANPSLEKAMGLRPVQPDVEIREIDPETQKTLTVNTIDRDDENGWEVVDAGGQVYRRFVDTDGDKRIDRWCYFNDGVEVYRDIDGDANGKPDAYRWLGTEGTRWGIDKNEDGQIEKWQQISPEEVTAEVIAAIATEDADRFAALVLSPRELASLELGETASDRLEAKASRAVQDFAALAKRQTMVSKDARWMQFAAPVPGVIPAGTDGGKKDVVAYENVVAMFEADGQPGQVLVGTLVRVDDAWRLVELPSLGTEENAVAQSMGNLIRPNLGGPATDSSMAGMDRQMQDLVAKLESLDGQLSQETDAKKLARLHAMRSDVLESLIKQSTDARERETWVRQLVDMLSVSVQTGAYPEGVKRMREVAPDFAKDDRSLAAYADYAAINSEFAVRNQTDDDFAANQRWYLESLEGFLKRYGGTPESAKAMLQLALSKEFEDDEEAALDYYREVAEKFPNTDEGGKAAGAVRRLESVGKPLNLRGRTVDGKPFELASLRGKPAVVHYWATWCDPCKQDMKLLRRLQAAYARQGLQIVGINVDGTLEQAQGFLKEQPLRWPQLFEPGGLETSPLANALGVQTLPTMLLVDPNGRVVRHNVRADELDAELAKMLRRKK